jgi:metal-responsive CopG/Arc/MetJ family transcriptional regulator
MYSVIEGEMARPKIMDNPTRMEMRFPAAMVDSVDRWRGRLPGVPSRCEAVRRLIEKGLEAVEAEGRNENGAGV